MTAHEYSPFPAKGPFRAVTLTPDPTDHSGPGVERCHLLNTLNLFPREGSVGVLAGPPRSGRTTLAMQWIASNGRSCQYVTDGSWSPIPEGWISEPDELGVAAAALFNLCAFGDVTADTHLVGPVLDRFLIALAETDEPLVLDGFDSASLDPLDSVLTAALHNSPNRVGRQSLAILNPGSHQHSAFLHMLGKTRLVSSTAFNFGRDEAMVYVSSHRGQMVPASEMDAIMFQTGGWMYALERMSSESSTLSSEIDALLLNRLTMQLPIEHQHFLISVSHLPHQSIGLWERLARQHGLCPDHVVDLIAHIPLSRGVTADGLFQIAPIATQSLKRQAAVVRAHEAFEQTLRDAIRFYVESDDLEAAKEVLTILPADDVFARQALVTVERLYHAEAWDDLATYYDALPLQVVQANDDLYYWSIITDYLLNRSVGRVSGGLDIVQSWLASEVPYVRGRALVLQASVSWDLADFDLMRAQAAAGLEALTPDYRVDRAIAAGAALRAETNVGGSPAAQTRLGNYIDAIAHLRTRERWAESVLAPATLGVLGLWGRLLDLYDHCQQTIINAQAAASSAQPGYLLVQAMVQIERRDLEEAARLIDDCSRQNTLPVLQGYITYARAQLAIANGDLAETEAQLKTLARDALRDDHLCQMIPLMHAQVALRDGNYTRAHGRFQFFQPLGDGWPKFFLAEHHELVRSTIHCQAGEHEAAIALATSVVQGSRERGHKVYEAAGLATLAYIHHMNGQRELRDNFVVEAEALAAMYDLQNSMFVTGIDVRELYGRQSAIPRSTDADEMLTPGKMSGRLTSRERQVLSLAARGLSNQEIATEMYLSTSTIKSHLTHVFAKLNVANRKQAVARARLMNLIPD